MLGSAGAQTPASGGWQGVPKAPEGEAATPEPTPRATPKPTPVKQNPPTDKSAPLPHELSPEARIARFFEQLGKGEVEGAYDTVLAGSKIGETPGDVAMLKEKTREAITMIGVIRGHDVVEVKTVGEHLKSYTCVALGRFYPLRWRFYFYQSEEVWRLIDIRISDRLSEMFNEEPTLIRAPIPAQEGAEASQP